MLLLGHRFLGRRFCRRRAGLYDLDMFDTHGSKRLVGRRIAGNARNLVDYFHGLALSEDRVLAVQVWRRRLGNKELRTVRIRSGISHRQTSWPVEFQVRRELVLELDRKSTRLNSSHIPLSR